MNFKAALDALDTASKLEAMDEAIKAIEAIRPDYGGLPEVIHKHRAVDALKNLKSKFLAPDTGHSEGPSRDATKSEPGSAAAPRYPDAASPEPPYNAQ
jgi:hypothetical protein